MPGIEKMLRKRTRSWFVNDPDQAVEESIWTLSESLVLNMRNTSINSEKGQQQQYRNSLRFIINWEPTPSSGIASSDLILTIPSLLSITDRNTEVDWVYLTLSRSCRWGLEKQDIDWRLLGSKVYAFSFRLLFPYISRCFLWKRKHICSPAAEERK